MGLLERAEPQQIADVAKADAIKTKLDALNVYLRAGSARVLLAFALAAMALRLLFVGQWGRGDVIVLLATVMLLGFVEWIIHLFFLHAPADSFRMRVLKTGTGHRQHHQRPTELYWVLLDKFEAGIFALIFLGFTAVWSIPILWLSGSAVVASYLTALALAYIGFAHYEWTHLLVHTAYRPKSRYYKRLARNHRLHHFRNEHYWLGVTANSGDRVLRTLPRNKGSVPLSETARNLAS